MTIVYRSTKGSNLTPSEVDGNFTDLAARTDLAWSQIGSDPVVREGVANAATLSNFRDGTNVLDTFPDPIFVIGADFFYQTNKFGTSSKSPPF